MKPRAELPPAYLAIEAKAQELAPLGYLHAFRTDLTIHDRKRIAQLDPKTPFFWIIRNHGTSLVDREELHGDKRKPITEEHRQSCVRMIAEAIESPEDRELTFLWTGETLWLVSVPPPRGEPTGMYPEAAIAIARGWLRGEP